MLLIPASSKSDNTGDKFKPEIKLKVIVCHLGFGKGDDRIKTDSFEIRLSMEMRIEIEEILTHLRNNGTLPEGGFIPYGLT